MPTIRILQAMLTSASATGGRSTALQPMGWLTAIVTVGFVIALSLQAPQWALILFGSLLGLSVCVYVVSYIYHAIKNPDALRSEKFTLSKMAIEKNLIGDDRSGLTEIYEFEDASADLALPDKSGNAE